MTLENSWQATAPIQAFASSRFFAAIALSAALHAGVLLANAYLIGLATPEQAQPPIAVSLITIGMTGDALAENTEAALADLAPAAPPPPAARRLNTAISQPVATSSSDTTAPSASKPVNSESETAAISPVEIPEATGTDDTAGAPSTFSASASSATQTVAPLSQPDQSYGTANYARALQNHLAKYLEYPRSAQRRDEQGEVLLAITVGSDGALMASMLRRSSGSATLDAAALALVARATPLPRPASQNIVAVEIPIRYRLQQK